MLRSQTPIAIDPPRRLISRALILSAALALAACAKPVATVAPPQPVRVQPVALNAAGQEESYTGAVRARVESDLAFRVNGKVIKRHVDVGQRVQAGDVVAELDPGDYVLGESAANNQRQAAAADAELAASDETRFKKLSAKGFVSRAEAERYHLLADAARERLKQATQQVELARNRVGYTKLRAPLDGIVTALHLETGQVLAEGQPAVTVAALGEREIVIDVPESRVMEVRDRPASATLWAAEESRFPVTLRELSPAATDATRTYQVRYLVGPDAPPMELGMTATVWIGSEPADDAASVATLPASALHHRDGEPAVWTAPAGPGSPTLVPVRVVRYGQEEVQLAGLHEGQLVVTAGVQKLNAAMRVVAVDADGKPFAASFGQAFAASDVPNLLAQTGSTPVAR